MSISTTSSALAHSHEGVVTSPHTLATEAGLEVLRQGGNAVEAAITMGACLSVTYPHFTGLGGDAFMIIADAKGGGKPCQALARRPRQSWNCLVNCPRGGLVPW